MIARRQLLLGGTLLALGGLAPPLPAATGFAAAIARLRRLVDDKQLPFAALRIARQGRVLADIHISGAETVGPETLYRIYSMTKPVVAAAVVLLVEDGRLRLEDPVARYVPEFARLTVLGAGNAAPEPARTMTIAHLLTHSSGLANSWGEGRVAPMYVRAGLKAGAWMYDLAIGSLDEFARRLAAVPLEFQPGSDWIYGYGLDIAGLVIQRVSGAVLGDFLGRRIFDPLGMASTGFQVPESRAHHLAGLYAPASGAPQRLHNEGARAALRPPVAHSGSAGLVSTLEDYGRFADMLANGGARHRVRVMRKASARLMLSPYGPQRPLAASLQRFGHYAPGSVAQALGGVIRLDARSGPGSEGEYAWGGAAGTGFWATPRLGLSVTVMTQLMPAPAITARDAIRPLIYQELAANG